MIPLAGRTRWLLPKAQADQLLCKLAESERLLAQARSQLTDSHGPLDDMTTRRVDASQACYAAASELEVLRMHSGPDLSTRCIGQDDVWHSFASTFGPFLKGAQVIVANLAYLGKPHQLCSLVDFLDLCVEYNVSVDLVATSPTSFEEHRGVRMN